MKTTKDARSSREKITAGITGLIFIKDEIEPADIIFIPGNGYPQMAEEAARLYRQGVAKVLLPSGKYSVGRTSFDGVRAEKERYRGNYRTEWEFLSDVLLMNGVPAEAILREESATFTYENAIRSRAVTDDNGIAVRRGIVCCQSVHAGRCKMYYRMLYPEAQILIDPVPANGVTAQNWTESKEGIDAVVGEAERYASQIGRMLKEGKL